MRFKIGFFLLFLLLLAIPAAVFAQGGSASAGLQLTITPSQQGGAYGAGDVFIPLFHPIVGGAARCNTVLDINGCFVDFCTTCHAVALAERILETLIALAIILAVMLFVYAGWLYLTTVMWDRRQAARKIFWNVFFGMIVVLIAWLIVDTLLKTLAGGGGQLYGRAWQSVLCDPGASINPCIAKTGLVPPPDDPGGLPQDIVHCYRPAGGGTDVCLPSLAQCQQASQQAGGGACFLQGGGPPVGPIIGDTYSHEAALAALEAAGITVTSTAGPGGVHEVCTQMAGCTSVNNLSAATVGMLVTMAKNCPTCDIVVIGGTEPGHDSNGLDGTGACTHTNGCKVDIPTGNQTTDQYIQNIIDEHGVPVTIPGSSRMYYKGQYIAPDANGVDHLYSFEI